MACSHQQGYLVQKKCQNFLFQKLMNNMEIIMDASNIRPKVDPKKKKGQKCIFSFRLNDLYH